MKVAIFVNTPAQVHFYRNIISGLIDHGNEILLLARPRGETIAILNELNIDYYPYSISFLDFINPKLRNILAMPLDIIKAYIYLRKKEVDLVTGFGLYDACTSKLLGIPSIIFTDDEPSSVSNSFNMIFNLYFPFISAIITPESFRQDLGPKHIKVNSYKELSYLHPNYFKPNSDIFDLLGLGKNESYVLLRFNAFHAFHDIYNSGFNDEDKIRLVNSLKNYTNVFISNEAGVPPELKDYVIKTPKSRIHDVLFYSKLFVTDTATMATEAAILGTPSIRCSTLVGKKDLGNFVELENRYKLLFNFSKSEDAIKKAIELIEADCLKDKWQLRRQNLLKEKTDIVSLFCWFLENYPSSIEALKGSLSGIDYLNKRTHL